MRDPRYKQAAKVTAKIMNHHLGKDEPTAIQFGKILFLIKQAMEAAEEEMTQIRLAPSEN
jgi:hypothetical protein